MTFPDDVTAALPRAHGDPLCAATIRSMPEDFIVIEDLGYAFSGEGEHVIITIEKRELNTLDVVQTLAKYANVKRMAVGFTGLKDRVAVTTQSFSVHLPGKPDLDWSVIESDSLKILSITKHNKKIRRGTLRGNAFSLVLRDIDAAKELVEQRLSQIQQHGVPNYFGAQRFGRFSSNLTKADAWFKGEGRRPKQEQAKMMVSAVRSYLFNQVLAARVEQGSWNVPLIGDVALLANSRAQFHVEANDDELPSRIALDDVRLSGPMPGDESRAKWPEGEALAFEQNALDDALAHFWIEQLRQRRIERDRRALRVMPENVSYEWLADASLKVNFSLVSGAFATSVLREIVTI
jgi:tRNA pseudouridine13 synthase